MAAASVQLTGRASGFARRGRPWFYRDDLAAGVASPGTRLRVLGFLMHTSLSAEDLEHRERRWVADNTDESTKVIAE